MAGGSAARLTDLLNQGVLRQEELLGQAEAILEEHHHHRRQEGLLKVTEEKRVDVVVRQRLHNGLDAAQHAAAARKLRYIQGWER